MELRHLRAFLAVAETGNFTKAAAINFVAQSGLSQQIARLETELGIKLFERDSRAVNLTDAGRVLLPRAQQILASIEATRGELDGLRAHTSGRLRVGLVQDLAPCVDLLAVVATFRERFPNVELRVIDLPSREMAAATQTGQLDLAVVDFDRVDLPDALVYMPLPSTPLVAVLSSVGRLAGLARLTVEDLAEAGPFVHSAPGSGLRQQVDAVFRRADHEPLRGVQLARIADMARFAAVNGGVAIVPAMREVCGGTIDSVPFSVIPLADDLAWQPAGIVMNSTRSTSLITALSEIVVSLAESAAGAASRRT